MNSAPTSSPRSRNGRSSSTRTPSSPNERSEVLSLHETSSSHEQAIHHRHRALDQQGGDVKLFMWNKYAGDPAGPSGTILFVHGSSMASQPTFDLQVPGRADSSVMDFFAARGYDTWCVDMEGYGRSTKTRDNNAPIALWRRRLLRRRDLYRRSCAASARSWSTAFRRARCARRCSRNATRRWSRGWRSMPWCGPARARPRSPNAASGCRNSAPRTAARSTASSCARSSSATIPAPPTTR